MANLRYHQMDESYVTALVAKFMTFANIPSTTPNASIIDGCIRAALMRVQEYADISLMQCKVKQRGITSLRGDLNLYLGGGDVESVIDVHSGMEMQFKQHAIDVVRVGASEDEIDVVFTTIPDAGFLVKGEMVVLRYATALYDGRPTSELNEILNEAL